MLFFYLLFAHLVSDYLLQPDYLVDWKNNSKWGLLTHSLIHFFCYFLVLFIYTGHYLVTVLALLLAVFHFIIDSAKAAHDKNAKNNLVTYWFDQAIHYLSILFVTIIAWGFNTIFSVRDFNQINPVEVLFFNPYFVIYLSIVIFSTLTIEYSFFKKRKRKNEIVLNKKNMIKRLFLASLIYIGLLFALIPGMSSFIGS